MKRSSDNLIMDKRVGEPYPRIFYVYGPSYFKLTESRKKKLDVFFNILGKNLHPDIARVDIDVTTDGVKYEGHIGGEYEFRWEDLGG